ncbi:MAG: hypothetical protein JW910_17680 [Anaerolineae bacterium]|nr:hypothetical protein [Anaerolineae bacterium]
MHRFANLSLPSPRHVLWLAVLLTAACLPLPQRTESNPDLVIGETAYTACSDLCIERGMCRELPDNTGQIVPVIHTRAAPGGIGHALRVLPVGAAVQLHNVQVNWTRDNADVLAGDTLYLVSAEAWEAEEQLWIPVYCLAPEPPASE